MRRKDNSYYIILILSYRICLCHWSSVCHWSHWLRCEPGVEKCVNMCKSWWLWQDLSKWVEFEHPLLFSEWSSTGEPISKGSVMKVTGPARGVSQGCVLSASLLHLIITQKWKIFQDVEDVTLAKQHSFPPEGFADVHITVPCPSIVCECSHNPTRFLGSQEPSEAQASRGCCRSRRWRRCTASFMVKSSLRVCQGLLLLPSFPSYHTQSLLGLSSGFPVQSRCLLLTHSFVYFVHS